MLERDEIILTLVGRCSGSASFGRTSLQKVAYLAEAMLGWGQLGHGAHYYGPYSRLLDRETNRLVRTGLISEGAEDLGFIGTSGYRGRQYHYQLTDEGERRLAVVRAQAQQDVTRLESVVDQINNVFGGLDQRLLSLAAKTHYIAKAKGRQVTPDEIRDAARELGWRLSPSMIADVAKRLESLGVLKVVEN